ncbi:MAG: hypothetical protein HZB66_00225 [Candidatus Aenigmarchaeota archaeon]|nr:hypothetical protein [Candidatus Aenigmarchaeota archaeon]
MWAIVLLLLLGLFLLSRFSDLCVRSVEKFAGIIGISHMAIGFVVVGITTSLPELAVAITSALKGEGALGVGTLIGANIADMTVVIGAVALFTVFRIVKKDAKEIYNAIAITSVIAVFAIFLPRIDAYFGMFCLILFWLSIATIMKKGIPVARRNKNIMLPTAEVMKAILIVAVSITLVVISAQIVVNAAIEISKIFGLAETLIGAGIIAFGTTLPELTVSIAAVRRGNYSLAIGNSIGSLVTNLALILGLSSILSVTLLTGLEHAAFSMLLVANVLFLILSMRMKFDRIAGIILLAGHALMLIILFSI